MNDYELLGFILNDIKEDLSNEDIIHLLIDKTVSHKVDNSETFGQKASDKLASFAGSWTFVLGFSAILVIWIILNTVWIVKSFDPYPFILLNLVLSCIAAVQAPLIMMSQKRQEQKDRDRNENDYKINLKSEILLKDIHHKLDRIIEDIENNSNES